MQAQTKLTVLFARHGETQHNKSKTLAGQQPGKLTEKGKDQARLIGKYLQHQSILFDYVYVSDLGRTKQTYQYALQKAPILRQVPRQFTQMIRQKSAGVLQNKPLSAWSENAKKQKVNIREYKCTKGESWIDVMNRARQFLRMLVEKHLIENCKKQGNLQRELRILVVSHGGFIMQMHNVCRQLNKESPIFDNSARNCSMHQFEIFYPNGQEFDFKNLSMKCIRNNFTGHLEQK